MSASPIPVLALRLWNHGGIGVARTLGRLGVPIYAVQSNPRAAAARSRHLRHVLEWDLETAPNDASLEYVLEAGRRIGRPAVLLAGDEPAQAFVSRNADALHQAFSFPRQPPGLTEDLYSKRGLYELCVQHDIPVPSSSFPQRRDEAREAIERVVFPIVLKPIDNVRFEKRNGIRMFIARDAPEALEAYDRFEDPGAPNIMLQEFIPGTSASVWVFTGYFDSRSELLFGAGGTKLRQCPIHTGTTCFGDVRSNSRMEELTAGFVKALGYSGVFDCGYRYDARDGGYKLLDVNPRVGANFRQCVGRDGLDVVRAMYLDLTGRPVPRDTPAEGRVWWVENYDVAAAFQSWREGGFSLRDWGSSLRRVDEPAWFDPHDLVPFWAMCTNPIRHRGARVLARAMGRS